MSVYGSVADWITYAGLRGTTVTDGTAATQSLQRASDYIRTRYAIRLGLADDDANVIEATYIAAGYDLATPGFWQKTYTPAEARVLTKVDSIQWTPIDSGAKGSDAQLPVSPAIDALFMSAGMSGAALFVV